MVDYLTVKAAAAFLGCSTSWVRYNVGWWRHGVPKSRTPAGVRGIPSYLVSDIRGVPPQALGIDHAKRMIYKPDLEEFAAEGRVTRPTTPEHVPRAS